MHMDENHFRHLTRWVKTRTHETAFAIRVHPWLNCRFRFKPRAGLPIPWVVAEWTKAAPHWSEIVI